MTVKNRLLSYLFEFKKIFFLNRLDNFRVQILLKPLYTLILLPLKIVIYGIYDLP